MHPRFETPDLLLPSLSRQSDCRRRARQPVTSSRVGSRRGPTSTTSAGRGPWISAARWRQIERFKFYARHAWQPGAWRWPLRAASRWRCDRDWYAFPSRRRWSSWCARRSRCRDGLVAGTRLFSAGRRRRATHHAAASAAWAPVPVGASQGARRGRWRLRQHLPAARRFRRTPRRERPPVVGIAVNLMTKRNALRMIAIARAAGARVVVGGPGSAALRGRVPRRRRRRRRHRRRGADARRVVAGAASPATPRRWRLSRP